LDTTNAEETTDGVSLAPPAHVAFQLGQDLDYGGFWSGTISRGQMLNHTVVSRDRFAATLDAPETILIHYSLSDPKAGIVVGWADDPTIPANWQLELVVEYNGISLYDWATKKYLGGGYHRFPVIPTGQDVELEIQLLGADVQVSVSTNGQTIVEIGGTVAGLPAPKHLAIGVQETPRPLVLNSMVVTQGFDPILQTEAAGCPISTTDPSIINAQDPQGATAPHVMPGDEAPNASPVPHLVFDANGGVSHHDFWSESLSSGQVLNRTAVSRERFAATPDEPEKILIHYSLSDPKAGIVVGWGDDPTIPANWQLELVVEYNGISLYDWATKNYLGGGYHRFPVLPTGQDVELEIQRLGADVQVSVSTNGQTIVGIGGTVAGLPAPRHLAVGVQESARPVVLISMAVTQGWETGGRADEVAEDLSTLKAQGEITAVVSAANLSEHKYLIEHVGEAASISSLQASTRTGADSYSLVKLLGLQNGRQYGPRIEADVSGLGTITIESYGKSAPIAFENGRMLVSGGFLEEEIRFGRPTYVHSVSIEQIAGGPTAWMRLTYADGTQYRTHMGAGGTFLIQATLTHIYYDRGRADGAFGIRDVLVSVAPEYGNEPSVVALAEPLAFVPQWDTGPFNYDRALEQYNITKITDFRHNEPSIGGTLRLAIGMDVPSGHYNRYEVQGLSGSIQIDRVYYLNASGLHQIPAQYHDIFNPGTVVVYPGGPSHNLVFDLRGQGRFSIGVNASTPNRAEVLPSSETIIEQDILWYERGWANLEGFFDGVPSVPSDYASVGDGDVTLWAAIRNRGLGDSHIVSTVYMTDSNGDRREFGRFSTHLAGNSWKLLRVHLPRVPSNSYDNNHRPAVEIVTTLANGATMSSLHGTAPSDHDPEPRTRAEFLPPPPAELVDYVLSWPDADSQQTEFSVSSDADEQLRMIARSRAVRLAEYDATRSQIIASLRQLRGIVTDAGTVDQVMASDPKDWPVDSPVADGRTFTDQVNATTTGGMELTTSAGALLTGVDGVDPVVSECDSTLCQVVGQVLLGRWASPEDQSCLGGVAEFAVGFTPIGSVMSFRDLVYDVTHWEWSAEHVTNTALDTAGIVVGASGTKLIKVLGKTGATILQVTATEADLQNAISGSWGIWQSCK
jgi:hypothetical protein